MAPVSTLGPQATYLKTRIRNHFFESGRRPRRKTRSVRRSAPRPGSATHGYRNPNPKRRRRRPSRRCSRVRWPRFPHLAPRPHPSKYDSESASSQPVTCSKDVRRGVRRRDRGQRPTATEIRMRNNGAGGEATGRPTSTRWGDAIKQIFGGRHSRAGPLPHPTVWHGDGDYGPVILGGVHAALDEID